MRAQLGESGHEILSGLMGARFGEAPGASSHPRAQWPDAGHSLTGASVAGESLSLPPASVNIQCRALCAFTCASVQCLRMPTVLRTGPYRFYFYSHEPNEPPHVHVDRDTLSAKFWLNPVGLARNLGFNARELRRLQSLVMEHQAEFWEAWNGHFGVGG